jgi:D-alanine transaminase
VLAKQKAKESGAFEAWFVDRNGFVTEGSSTNAWIVTAGGTIVTRSAEAGILRGVTRTGVLDVASDEALNVEERPFSVAEALSAGEAFLTSASLKVTAVIRIDGVVIGNGRPGPVANRLRRLFWERAKISTLWASGA